MGVCTVQNQTLGPWQYRGLAANLAFPAAGWGPTPVQTLDWRCTVPMILQTDSHLPWQYSFWTEDALHLANLGSSHSKSFYGCSPTPSSCLGHHHKYINQKTTSSQKKTIDQTAYRKTWETSTMLEKEDKIRLKEYVSSACPPSITSSWENPCMAQQWAGPQSGGGTWRQQSWDFVTSPLRAQCWAPHKRHAGFSLQLPPRRSQSWEGRYFISQLLL